MDPTPAAQRRLKAINAHLITSADDNSSDHLQSNPTAAEFFSGTYSLKLVFVFVCIMWMMILIRLILYYLIN